MTKETLEQVKARLKRQDEEKERAFDKTLEDDWNACAAQRRSGISSL